MGAPSWRRKLLSTGWIGRAVGRPGGRSGGRRSGGLVECSLGNALLQRGLLNIGCSFGDGVCGVLGALPWKRRLLNSGCCLGNGNS